MVTAYTLQYGKHWYRQGLFEQMDYRSVINHFTKILNTAWRYDRKEPQKPLKILHRASIVIPRRCVIWCASNYFTDENSKFLVTILSYSSFSNVLTMSVNAHEQPRRGYRCPKSCSASYSPHYSHVLYKNHPSNSIIEKGHSRVPLKYPFNHTTLPCPTWHTSPILICKAYWYGPFSS